MSHARIRPHGARHRDLKLGNLFLGKGDEVKIGDFGLACKLQFDGERKRTLCGTPNYIAPEVRWRCGVRASPHGGGGSRWVGWSRGELGRRGWKMVGGETS